MTKPSYSFGFLESQLWIKISARFLRYGTEFAVWDVPSARQWLMQHIDSRLGLSLFEMSCHTSNCTCHRIGSITAKCSDIKELDVGFLNTREYHIAYGFSYAICNVKNLQKASFHSLGFEISVDLSHINPTAGQALTPFSTSSSTLLSSHSPTILWEL